MLSLQISSMQCNTSCTCKMLRMFAAAGFGVCKTTHVGACNWLPTCRNPLPWALQCVGKWYGCSSATLELALQFAYGLLTCRVSHTVCEQWCNENQYFWEVINISVIHTSMLAPFPCLNSTKAKLWTLSLQFGALLQIFDVLQGLALCNPLSFAIHLEWVAHNVRNRRNATVVPKHCLQHVMWYVQWAILATAHQYKIWVSTRIATPVSSSQLHKKVFVL